MYVLFLYRFIFLGSCGLINEGRLHTLTCGWLNSLKVSWYIWRNEWNNELTWLELSLTISNWMRWKRSSSHFSYRSFLCSTNCRMNRLSIEWNWWYRKRSLWWETWRESFNHMIIPAMSSILILPSFLSFLLASITDHSLHSVVETAGRIH